MKTPPGYFIDAIASQPWYRCLQCKYDVFSQDSIRNHVKTAHLPLTAPEPPEIYPVAGRKIGISFLTWNTVAASVLGMQAICREAKLLQGHGAIPTIIWVDNGSGDGTKSAVKEVINSYNCSDLAVIHDNPTNMGQGYARNSILDSARGLDYLLMVDGDIEIIPYSALAMVDFLEKDESGVGCIGMYCRNCTNTPDSDVADECRAISTAMASPDPAIAWTNYGMFRVPVFESCRFDTSGPFAGPGWGFEDDDFYMQMMVAGWKSVNTNWFRHLHRTRHSSVRLLGKSLAAKVHADRKAYLLAKWRDVPEAQAWLSILANQTMPVVD